MTFFLLVRIRCGSVWKVSDSIPALLPKDLPHSSLPHLFEEHVGTVYDGLWQVDLVGHVADFPEGIDQGTV